MLNPRRLVEAQIKIAKEQGCHVLDGYATNIVRVSDSGKISQDEVLLKIQILKEIFTGKFLTSKVINFLPIPVFAISASHTDGSGESFIFAKKVILASGVYVNLNDWLQVSLTCLLCVLQKNIYRNFENS